MPRFRLVRTVPGVIYPALADLLIEGDSISVPFSDNYVGKWEVIRPDIDFTNNAAGGSTVQDNGGLDLVTRFAADYALNPAYVTVFIGANDSTTFLDVGPPTVDPANWLTKLQNYIAGWTAHPDRIVAVGTILPQYRSDNALFTTAFNERRAIINEAIREGAGVWHNAVIDFAADPDMGPDEAAEDLTLYDDDDADGDVATIHPTLALGHVYLRDVYTPVVDAMVSGLPQPILTQTNAPGSPPTFNIAVSGYIIGYYWNIQVASDLAFTTALSGEGAIRDGERSVTLEDTTDDDLDGFVEADPFDELASLPDGPTKVRIRLGRDDDEGILWGLWSNIISEVIV